MLRISSAAAVGVALACAFLLYAVSYDTRRLELMVQAEERRAERLRGDIAVLKAELAYLSRPERIAPLARAMGLEPVRGEQLIELAPLPPGAHAAGAGGRTPAGDDGR
ncbi:MAG: cell division protein FtsL [Hyphomicrobiaceae bacterium]|nr:cell division protein FtsL [Hyphomicrobiaceae bacterium]